MGQFNKKHGLYNHRLYGIWGGIKDRCYNPKSAIFQFYGGRGIKMCEEWKTDFKKFYDWCLSNGWEKGLEVDRHPNNDGDYEPNNCRIATERQNSNNRRDTVYVEYQGEKMPFQYACEKVKISSKTMHVRMKKMGLTFDQAILFIKKMPTGENHFRYKNNPEPMLKAKDMIKQGISIREINRKTG